MLETNGIRVLGNTLVIVSSSAVVSTPGPGIMDAAATPPIVTMGMVTTGVVAITTGVVAITTAAQATTMVAAGVIRIPATIHPGRTRRMGTTRIHITGVIPIHTMGVIRTPLRTISQDMVTTLQRLQRCSAAWVNSATITAQSMALWGHKPGQRSPLLKARMG